MQRVIVLGRNGIELVIVAPPQVTESPSNPRDTTSIRSSMMSFVLLLKRRPTVKNPIAAKAV